METEQESSQFQPLSKEKLISTVEAFDILSKRSLSYAASPKVDLFLYSIFSRFYTWLDSLSGKESSIILSKHDLILNPFQKILQFLKMQGIVKDATFGNSRYNDAPVFFRVDVSPTYPPSATDGRISWRPLGRSSGKDAEAVLSKAIGEFLERYFLTLYHTRNLLFGSHKSLQKRGYQPIDFNTLAEFSQEQKDANSRFKWDEKRQFYWEKVMRGSTAAKIFIPAQFVYWNYISNELEPLLREPNTNGNGGMFTKEGAILSGLYELIQRDAFLIYWLNRLAPPKITAGSVQDKVFLSILEESKRYGFKIHCLNITSDIGAPSFAVAVEDPSGTGPRFSVGGGCQANPVLALRRALEEAWAVYYGLRAQPPYSLAESYQPFRDDSIGRRERLRLWANPEMSEKFLFILAGEERNLSEFQFSYPNGFISEKKELDYLVQKIENIGPGYEVYYYLAQHPILSQLGYNCARVIVPQFIPLYLNETMAPLDAKRLRGVPAKLGYKPADAFNPWPHPFP